MESSRSSMVILCLLLNTYCYCAFTSWVYCLPNTLMIGCSAQSCAHPSGDRRRGLDLLPIVDKISFKCVGLSHFFCTFTSLVLAPSQPI